MAGLQPVVIRQLEGAACYIGHALMAVGQWRVGLTPLAATSSASQAQTADALSNALEY